MREREKKKRKNQERGSRRFSRRITSPPVEIGSSGPARARVSAGPNWRCSLGSRGVRETEEKERRWASRFASGLRERACITAADGGRRDCSCL